MPMYVTQTRKRIGYRPCTVPPPRQPTYYRGLSLGNYHIRDSRGSGIMEAVRMERIGVFVLMILMETNITDKAYC